MHKHIKCLLLETKRRRCFKWSLRLINNYTLKIEKIHKGKLPSLEL